jgi:HSP20 family protein
MAEKPEVARPEFPMPRRLFDWLRWPEPWPFGEEMRLEEFVDGDEFVVRAEMPGLDPEKDIDIQIGEGTLRIRAERRQESKTTEQRGYRSEFRYGSVARSAPLPAGTTEKDVKASYKDGILEVLTPIDRGRAEAKKISVQRG